jgi:hypothetical protein
MVLCSILFLFGVLMPKGEKNVYLSVILVCLVEFEQVELLLVVGMFQNFIIA